MTETPDVCFSNASMSTHRAIMKVIFSKIFIFLQFFDQNLEEVSSGSHHPEGTQRALPAVAAAVKESSEASTSNSTPESTK